MNNEKLLATLKAVQAAGWWITGADAAGVEVACPDCAGTHHFPIGSDVPRLLQSFSSEGISSGSQGCAILAARREGASRPVLCCLTLLQGWADKGNQQARADITVARSLMSPARGAVHQERT